jgi:hypothetical protein
MLSDLRDFRAVLGWVSGGIVVVISRRDLWPPFNTSRRA